MAGGAAGADLAGVVEVVDEEDGEDVGGGLAVAGGEGVVEGLVGEGLEAGEEVFVRLFEEGDGAGDGGGLELAPGRAAGVFVGE